MDVPTPTHLVILVHGMNTRANWMAEVRDLLEENGFAVASTSYGFFSPLKFLSPIFDFRRTAINRVLDDIRTAQRVFRKKCGFYPREMSVISHSFGTYVVARILLEAEDLTWNRVIFCGSVVREDFPFFHAVTRFEEPLLNEIGTKDYWPAFAESCGWGYGSVGTTGFNRPAVYTRWHDGLTHSDFLTADFCKRNWIDFLRGNKPKSVDKPPKEVMPLWVRFLAFLPLRYLQIILPFAAIVVLSVYIVSVLNSLDGVNDPVNDSVPKVEIEHLENADLGAPISEGTPQAFYYPSEFLEGKWIASLDEQPKQSLFVTENRDAMFSRFGPAKFFRTSRLFPPRVGMKTHRLHCLYEARMSTTTTIEMKWWAGSPQCPSRILLVRPAS